MNFDMKDPEDFEYNILCKIHVFEKYFMEEGKKHVTKMVALIPRIDCQQGVAFLNAWLPGTRDEYYEVMMQMAHPVSNYCLGAVQRDTRECSEYHIVVMSTGVVEMLKSKHGQEIQITVMPQGNEHLSEAAPSIERTVKEHYVPESGV